VVRELSFCSNPNHNPRSTDHQGGLQSRILLNIISPLDIEDRALVAQLNMENGNGGEEARSKEGVMCTNLRRDSKGGFLAPPCEANNQSGILQARVVGQVTHPVI